ncbi:RING-type domain-containing protein [Aphis craccivora]|uniref:RING-type domain-containing protein n=1 Tax=Aphis craccivora TaxID=307492 RepID=A0A6G0W0Q6_APHCR|nr:RING-type domain-containing protein [Aphis craccivora]
METLFTYWSDFGAARLDPCELRKVYTHTNPRASILYSWPTAESSMCHARRQTLPPLPSALCELSEYLDLNTERYQCNFVFYQEWIVNNPGKYNIMFACHELISAVVHQGATKCHADATFKVVPSTPYCRQLFIIHLILQNHSIPVCYVLIEAKTEASYREVMERFKIKFPEVRELTIMLDFEIALRQVFLNIYPEAQSLQKNIKKMGYSGYVCFWLIGKGRPECFSVHSQPRRTNNNVESFHSTLKQTFQVMHPNLWTMLKYLKNMSKKMHVVVDQLSARYLTKELNWHEEIEDIFYLLYCVKIKSEEQEQEQKAEQTIDMPRAVVVDAEANLSNNVEVINVENPEVPEMPEVPEVNTIKFLKMQNWPSGKKR